jgi:uncharacterized protein (TIGR02246 family)
MFGHNSLGIPMDLSVFNQRPSAQAFVQHWLDTVCTHNPIAITNLYLTDGVLLGTVAENIKYGQGEIRSYFDMFVQKQPCGVITSISSADYHGVSVVNGNYVFELNEGGTISQVPARFTFVLKQVGGGWRIDTHHSSAQP